VDAFIYSGCFVAGLVVPRWWLLPLPLVVDLIVESFMAHPADDFSGLGRLVTSIVATLVLASGIAAGKLARRRGWFSN
jgi:hypothetical protein